MGSIIIIAIVVLVAIISVLTVVIVKSTAGAKRVETLPKLIKQGKTQAAIKIAKQIIAKDPKNYAAHYYLGQAYVKDNRPELAIIEFKMVNDNALFGQDINELDFRNEYAKLLIKFNQQQDALRNYLLLTKLDPHNAENYYNAGKLYEDAGRYDLALGFMKKATALDKRHAKAHAETGLMLYRMKNFADARMEIDTSLKLCPDNYGAYYYLGKIEKDSKDIAAAIKSFEKAQRDPELKQKAIIEHGSCYMLANRYDNAAVDFQRAVELDKENLNGETLYARYFLAACYEKGHQIEKAIEQWEQIYKRNKSFRDVSAKLAEYKDLQANDHLKDYLTCNNDEFELVCKHTCEKGLKYEILTSEKKKWGMQFSCVENNKESWMNVRKQVLSVRFYREPNPIDDAVVREALDSMKSLSAVKVVILSSSGYTNGAKLFAENRPVELIDKPKLENILTAAGN